jgi:DNA-binding HxlR family transcriptional regulator
MRKMNSTNAVNEQQILQSCGMAYTLSLVGGRWKPAILWALVNNGILRYGQLRKIVVGVSERVLATQLKELEGDGLVERMAYAEVPPRVEYKLTPLGQTMEPLLHSISAWGEQYKEQKALQQQEV